MPDVTIQIGGRSFEVSCQPGEESFLQSAARMLDDEAQVLSDHIGRIPEARMLLMAGLLLADKTAAIENKIKKIEAELAEAQAEVETLRSIPAPEPKRIEVAAVPTIVIDALAELAARAEAVAADIEERAAALMAQDIS
ncbi:MAG: cell division protein ZapA [Rhodobacteraceae bacterium]|nr:cell division protein ZapA [Paracoccaceae bacterium]